MIGNLPFILEHLLRSGHVQRAKAGFHQVALLSASDGPSPTYCRTKIIQIDGSKVSDGRYEIPPRTPQREG